MFVLLAIYAQPEHEQNKLETLRQFLCAVMVFADLVLLQQLVIAGQLLHLQTAVGFHIYS